MQSKTLPGILKTLMVTMGFMVVLAAFASQKLAAQTNLINLDFNGAGTSTYTRPGLVGDLSVSVSGQTDNFAGGAGGCYITNATANSTVAASSGSGTFTFAISGDTLESFKTFTGCVQARRSSTGPPSVAVTYSINGGAYTAATVSGSPGDGSFSNITFSLPTGANNPTTLSIRLAFTGGSGSGTIRVDNFQLRGTFSPPASITAPSSSLTSFCNSSSTETNVSFTASGLSGTYTAELSNSAGSFTTPVATATGTTSPIALTIPSGLAAGTGYRIRVKNGAVVSSNVNVSVTAPPVISTQPTNKNLCAGGDFVLSVAATPATGYRWTQGGTLIGGATTATYSKASATTADAGSYQVLVINGACTTASNTAAVVIENSPTVAISAADEVICYNGATTINFNGTPNAVVAYTANGSTTPGVTLSAAGTASIALADITANQLYELVNVASPSLACNNPSVAGNQATVAVRALPAVTAFSASAANVCPGGNAIITFEGTPNTTVSFTANGITQTTPLDAAGNGAYMTGALEESATFALSDVQYTAVPACPVSITGNTTVNLYTPPVAVITPAGPLTFCEGNGALLTAGEGTGYAYAFNKDGIAQPATANTFFATAEGSYLAIVTDGATGCKDTSASVIITVTNPVDGALPAAATTASATVPDGASVTLTNAECRPVATVADAPGGNVLGLVNANLSIESAVGSLNGQPYLQRQYDIEPASNGPATITLYYTQAEFNAFNIEAENLDYAYRLPADASDADALKNVAFTVYHSAGDGGPGGMYDEENAEIVYGAQINAVYNGDYWALTFPVSGFSAFFLSADGGPNPLAVHLTEFNAYNEGHRNRISWITASEEAGDRMVVERSADGRHFSAIATVVADGQGKAYTSYDEQPAKGINYYRLRFTVAGDKETFSNTVAVRNNAGIRTIAVYPNPAEDMLYISLPQINENYTFRIADMTGRDMPVTATGAAISVAQLAPGAYVLTATNGTETYQARFMKK